MTDQNTSEAAKAAEAPAKAVEAATEVTKTVAKKAEEAAVKATKPATARRARKSSAKPARKAAARKTVRKAKRVSASQKIINDNVRTARKIGASTAEGIKTMNKNTNNAFSFGAFETLPGFAPFQNMITGANERGQDFAKKSQKVAEELADLAKANVEAMVEAGKIAVQGSKALGQDLVATGRDGVEQASDAIRSLAEAKSPTEYVQLQGEFARASFDRMVAETSKLTEAMVKLAGEAFQPIQNRASKNAERFNTFVA